jgi:hypothetical protein
MPPLLGVCGSWQARYKFAPVEDKPQQLEDQRIVSFMRK